jgi:hypothetical protein
MEEGQSHPLPQVVLIRSRIQITDFEVKPQMRQRVTIDGNEAAAQDQRGNHHLPDHTFICHGRIG